jgi:hypothetical protein
LECRSLWWQNVDFLLGNNRSQVYFVVTHLHGDGLVYFGNAGWSSPVARQAHNLKVVGSNPAPATKLKPLKTLVKTEPPQGGFLLTSAQMVRNWYGKW